MTEHHLIRIRWGVRGALFLGVATSVAANVLHADPNPISQTIAAWPPLALLLTVELISRVPVHSRGLAVVRLAATGSIASIAAWVSYWHMAGVTARYGEDGAAPYLIPLSVDGLVVVASVCLVELAGRIDATTPRPVPDAPPTVDTAPDTTADNQPEPVTDSGQAPKRTPRKPRRPDTATAVVRLRTRYPDMSAADIARRIGVTDRTVRRHLKSSTAEPA